MKELKEISIPQIKDDLWVAIWLEVEKQDFKWNTYFDIVLDYIGVSACFKGFARLDDDRLINHIEVDGFLQFSDFEAKFEESYLDEIIDYLN